MEQKVFLRWSLFLFITCSLLWGCAGKGKDVKTIEGDPEPLYKQGLARFNKRDYSEALKKFEELKSSFPDHPPFTIWAELKIGDCHFFKEEYIEAIAAYEEFKKIHPTHEEIPYVQYQIGMAYFNQMLTLDRDQTSTKKALSNFEYLIANNPQSLFAEKAKKKIDICLKRLADHEFYIGNYYYKKGQFKAASSRFQGLIEKFPKMPKEDITLFLLGKSYLEIDEGEKAKGAFAKIVNEYPKSPHYREAKEILDRGPNKKKTLLHQTKTKEPKEKGDSAKVELGKVSLVKFEEEGRRSVSFFSNPSEPVKTGLPKEEVKEEAKEASERMEPPMNLDQTKEDKIQMISTPVVPEVEPKKKVKLEEAKPPDEELKVTLIPKEEPPEVTSPDTQPKTEVRPEEERRITALPTPLPTSSRREKTRKEVLLETGQAKLVDRGLPIDITSDRVETYSKENLIVFKGNVMARQKDIVIYADSLEAVIIADGKGIEKVVAGGNVKIQQGLRVASCQRAIFYNFDQKVVLMGDPKVWEGENMVSGDEIVFDIEQNRVEVKGGAGGRGKAKIHPGEGFEKLK